MQTMNLRCMQYWQVMSRSTEASISHIATNVEDIMRYRNELRMTINNSSSKSVWVVRLIMSLLNNMEWYYTDYYYVIVLDASGSYCVACGNEECPRTKPKMQKHDDWVQCDDCGNWYHVLCVKYKLVTSDKYSCKLCS